MCTVLQKHSRFSSSPDRPQPSGSHPPSCQVLRLAAGSRMEATKLTWPRRLQLVRVQQGVPLQGLEGTTFAWLPHHRVPAVHEAAPGCFKSSQG